MKTLSDKHKPEFSSQGVAQGYGKDRRPFLAVIYAKNSFTLFIVSTFFSKHLEIKIQDIECVTLQKTCTVEFCSHSNGVLFSKFRRQ